MGVSISAMIIKNSKKFIRFPFDENEKQNYNHQ